MVEKDIVGFLGLSRLNINNLAGHRDQEPVHRIIFGGNGCDFPAVRGYQIRILFNELLRKPLPVQRYRPVYLIGQDRDVLGLVASLGMSRYGNIIIGQTFNIF
ncbi:hypothetical protein D3C76_1702320 [compost metagenome]